MLKGSEEPLNDFMGEIASHCCQKLTLLHSTCVAAHVSHGLKALCQVVSCYLSDLSPHLILHLSCALGMLGLLCFCTCVHPGPLTSSSCHRISHLSMLICSSWSNSVSEGGFLRFTPDRTNPTSNLWLSSFILPLNKCLLVLDCVQGV